MSHYNYRGIKNQNSNNSTKAGANNKTNHFEYKNKKKFKEKEERNKCEEMIEKNHNFQNRNKENINEQ